MSREEISFSNSDIEIAKEIRKYTGVDLETACQRILEAKACGNISEQDIQLKKFWKVYEAIGLPNYLPPDPYGLAYVDRNGTIVTCEKMREQWKGGNSSLFQKRDPRCRYCGRRDTGSALCAGCGAPL
ncbi:hypothetical protein EHQ12_04215 [Leptospira gomenensis]|uniref:Uncharacterized protein n=1 Tax=Leptospira gomenensis TaxID=2484974 RepID=A0A5F1YDP3_9LEPT|nr:hypothetical protein [Leptospira gomenensis]TGK36181.1 hypothetical protein EHQ17_04500 [Leptospira gomenensis]TGK42779.1 hypothetical protein EHQ07_13990 [Leptospira gomenensis]TGK42968.1 hypothetical protein EHQ12_04215 [Leptospira gomenensis]TGK54923.1 hypothetical protein EHQ13_18160 [Leptospira gomenensis]